MHSKSILSERAGVCVVFAIMAYKCNWHGGCGSGNRIHYLWVFHRIKCYLWHRIRSHQFSAIIPLTFALAVFLFNHMFSPTSLKCDGFSESLCIRQRFWHFWGPFFLSPARHRDSACTLAIGSTKIAREPSK